MRQPREGSRDPRSTTTILGRNRSTIATILSLFTVLTLILGQGTLAFAGQSKEIGADTSGSAVAGTGGGSGGSGGGTTGGTGGGTTDGTGGTVVRPTGNATSGGGGSQRPAGRHHHKTHHKTRTSPVDHKVTICHGTDSYSNPYVVDTPDIGSNGYAEGGHAQHVGPVWYPTIPKNIVWGDIIPSYDYEMADGSIFHYPGLNWTAAGQKIWNNGCRPPPPPVPSIKVTKTCPAAASIGDVIQYSITVTNTGNETLENLVVNDPMLGALSFPGTLAAGASVSKTVNYTVKASDPDPIHNVVTASAKGAESGKSVSDTASCDTDIVHQPGISVTKTCPASANVGDTIQYSITVKNTGNETLNSISVTDPLLGNISGSFKSSLAPGESDTHTFSYTVTPASTDPVHNVVSASGTGADSGKQVSDSDTCDTDVLHKSGIKVTKTCPATAAIGDSITYTITVENTGNEPLNSLVVSDPFLGNISGSFPSSLAVGQKVTRTFSYTITASTPDPIHNVVTATATGADSGAQVTDSASCNTDIVHHPGIDVTKSCPASAKIGDTIQYSITVKNTGDEPLNGVTVTDSILGNLSASFPNTLAVGQSVTKTFTHVVTASDADPLINNVAASATGADSGTGVSDAASCQTDVLHEPGISVTKTCPASANIGDTIQYSITVKNTGNETLNSISVVDPLLGNLAGYFKSSLAPNESETHIFGYTITSANTDPVHNVVTASGTGADSGKQVSDSDTCDTDVLHQSGIKVTKTCPASANIGDKITYSITVENTGNEPLNNVIVSDPFLGNISGSFPNSLAVGQKVTKTFDYTITASTPDPIHNVVTATATGADSGSQVADSASCNTDVVHHPGIDVTKSCPASAKIGDTVTYSITVTNTGDEPLNGVAVDDSILGNLSSSFPSTLAVGQSVTKTFDHVVTASDADPVVNDVTASATGVDSAKQVSDSDSCQTDVQHEPGISVTKTCPASANIGDVITYSITVENTGNEPLKNVAVIDPLLGSVSGAFPGTLAVGQSVTKTFTYTVSATDPDPLTNVVTASGTGTDSGQTVSDQASCQTDILHHPGIDVSKTCPAGANVGDRITYAVTLTNTGDEPLTGITVTDTMFGDVSSSFPSTLAVGQSVTKTFTHVVTASDPASLQNAVTASGSGADSKSQVTDTAECGTSVTQHPAIHVVKGGPALAHVGDTITYTFAVSNTGDVPLHDVTLSDAKCDTGFTLESKTGGNQDNILDNNGEVWNYTCTHVVLATDADPLPNTVTAQGLSPHDETVSDQDSHQVDLIHPAISIVKSSDVASAEAGQTVTYTYVVTNTGDTPLTGVSVDDDILGHIGDIPSLAVGASVTLTHTFEFPADLSPVVNIGTAAGCDALEGCVSAEDTVTVFPVAAVCVVNGKEFPEGDPRCTPEPPVPPQHKGGVLPFTGSNPAALVFIFGMLVLGGTILTRATRWRRRNEA